MADQKISEFAEITSPLGADFLPALRAGVNKRISVVNLFTNTTIVTGLGFTPLNAAADYVSNFMGRIGPITLTSADLNGLSGAGLSGIGTGTGGILNTGTTTIGADTDSDGVGSVVLQTRTLNRFTVNNDGTLTAAGKKLTLGDTSVADAARIDLKT